MDTNLINSAEAIGMFCRLHMHLKRDLPIRASEMGVLIFTHKQSDPVTPLMISQFFNIAKPSVSSMIKALIKQGYLIKDPSEVDKRSYALVMTESGKNLVESTFVEYLKSYDRLKGRMGQESFNQLIELIQVANRILEEVK